MNINSVVLSIISMLSSCKEKSRPPNDSDHVRRAKGRSPKEFNWLFDDDKC